MAYLNGKPIFFSPQVHITVPEVVQKTGDSETAVMSQKAVTGLFDKVSKVAQTATQKIGTLSEFPLYNGHILNAGTWGNVIDAYKHIVIPVEGGQKISMTSSNDGDLYFACLTDYTDVVPGAAVAFSKEEGWTTKRYQGNDKTADYIIPSDGKYLVLCVVTAGIEAYPTALVIGDYNYFADIGKNAQALNMAVSKNTANINKNTDNIKALMGGSITLEELFNPIKYSPVWENGGYNNAAGSPLSNFNHNARRRTEHLSFDTRVNIVSDGTYLVTLSLCDENLNLVRYRQYTDAYSGDFLCIPPYTPFRLMVQDATDSTKDISAVTSEEINKHISVYRNGTSYFANPKVRWCAMGDSITQGYVSTGATAPSSPTPAKGWAHKVADMKNWIITNNGVGGSGWIQGGTNPPQPAWTVAENTDFTQFDIVTLAYGINDWNTSVPIGSIDDYDPSANPTTVISSMCKTLDTIIASNPLCKVFVITPLNCWWKGDESTNWGIGAENANGVTLEQFVQTIETVCKYYGVEVIDMTHSSVVNRKNIQSCMLDKVHPTEAAHTAIAHELSAKINFE